MKYKVQVLTNRVTAPFKEDLERCRLYNLKHKIELEYTIKEVDVRGYRSVWNEHAKRYFLVDAEKLVTLDPNYNATMFMFDENEWANPPGSEFPLRPDTPAGSCQMVDGKPFICAPTSQYDHDTGIQWVMFCHELMHSYVLDARIKGIYLQDFMDTYLNNADPDHPNGNFATQWKILDPWLNRTLKLGMKGEDVKALQSDLNALGATLISDGDFGMKTKNAVVKFQKENNLVADGVAGKATKAKIAEKKTLNKFDLLPLVYRKSELLVKQCADEKMFIRITEGRRTFERQNYLWSLGRTIKSYIGVTSKKPLGDTVTDAKAGESYHNYGVAFDIVFIKEGYNGNWARVAEIAKGLGFGWGGDFPKQDKPHMQLTLGFKLKDFKQNKVDYSKYN